MDGVAVATGAKSMGDTSRRPAWGARDALYIENDLFVEHEPK